MHLETEPGIEPPEDVEDSDEDSDPMSNPYGSEYQVRRSREVQKHCSTDFKPSMTLITIMTPQLP